MPIIRTRMQPLVDVDVTDAELRVLTACGLLADPERDVIPTSTPAADAQPSPAATGPVDAPTDAADTTTKKKG